MLKVLILTDSRGHSLGKQLFDIDLDCMNIDLHIMPYSGARIDKVVEKGLKDCRRYVYDRVYLMAGVNELSFKKGCVIFPRYSKVDIIVREVMIKYHEARVKLDTIAPEVVICELVGLSYWMYNSYCDNHAYPKEQAIINAAVIRINEYVHEMNDERGLLGPCIANITHKIRGETEMEHRYRATLHDGLHFNRAMATKVLDRFIINML